MSNILLLEDDESLNRGISFKLKKEGHAVFSAYSMEEALNMFNSNEIHLVITDVMLPDGNGFDFCSKIRSSSDVLIVFLTACDQEVDMVSGYDMGGDDYITKPFSLMVLISKINALLRRHDGSSKIGSRIISGDIVFYNEEIKVLKNDVELVLSKNEYRLLKYLMLNHGQIVTKEQLLNELWDADGMFVDQNTVAVNIRRLREKIEDDPSSPKYIKTARGMGYSWAEGCVSR